VSHPCFMMTSHLCPPLTAMGTEPLWVLCWAWWCSDGGWPHPGLKVGCREMGTGTFIFHLPQALLYGMSEASSNGGHGHR